MTLSTGLGRNAASALFGLIHSMQSVSSPMLRVAVGLVVRVAVLLPRMLRDHAPPTHPKSNSYVLTTELLAHSGTLSSVVRQLNETTTDVYLYLSCILCCASQTIVIVSILTKVYGEASPVGVRIELRTPSLECISDLPRSSTVILIQ